MACKLGPPDDWETVQSVDFELPCRYCRRENCGDLLCFTRSDCGYLPQFPLKCPSTAVAKYASVDLDSFMVLCIVVPPPHCWEFLNNMFLEQWIGWCRLSAWPAHSLAIYPLDCYIWWYLKSSVYVCYRIHWYPGLRTAITEWIWDDPYDTRNFPVDQQITVQSLQRSVMKLKVTLRALSLIIDYWPLKTPS